VEAWGVEVDVISLFMVGWINSTRLNYWKAMNQINDYKEKKFGAWSRRPKRRNMTETMKLTKGILEKFCWVHG